MKNIKTIPYVIILLSCIFTAKIHAQSLLEEKNIIYGIVTMIGVSKADLLDKYGKPWKEFINEYNTEFLYYGHVYALFTIDGKSGRVVYAQYPISNSYGEVQKGVYFSYNGISCGMTKSEVKNKLGKPSLAGIIAWTYNRISNNAKYGGKSVFTVIFSELGTVESLQFGWISGN
jgi:hypothetical protein